MKAGRTIRKEEGMANPYSTVFGRQPEEMISRPLQMQDVTETFLSDPASQQIYMITGVRGSGKTVFMTNAAEKIAQDENFVVVELNPERDMLTALAAKLASYDSLASIFRSAKINLSFFGIGLEVSNSVPVTDIETALSRMLGSLQKKGKKVLVTIDEVTNSPDMKVFAASFQIFLRQELPIFLLMTGLYENIYALQNEKTLTFLYRAPKIELSSLNIGAIKENYKQNFQLSDEDAREMAKETKGYSFAFQVLGYLTYRNHGDFRGVRQQYRQYLEEYSYEKIWSELSSGDRKILYAMTVCPGGRILDIRNELGMTTNQFNPYRRRLIRKGIITGQEHGYVQFALPLFDEFVKEYYGLW